MTTPTIERINHLKNVGIFADVSVGSFPHEFKKFNLVYGFNGGGKTTLSRLLGMLSEDRIAENLPESSEYSFSLSDGSKPSHANLESSLRRYIAVFNEDYIERSLTWREASARPIIYLGKEQGELVQKLADLEAKEVSVNSDFTLKSADFGSDERAFGKLCTSGARLIANELGLGRSYTAPKFRQDHIGLTLEPSDSLSEGVIAQIKTTISRADLPEKIEPISSPPAGSVYSEVAAALKSQVSDISIEALQRRKDALHWVDIGLQLHHDESECLFCGNDLTESRSNALREALQSGFGEFTKKLESASSAVSHFLEECRQFEEQLNQPYEALPEHSASIEQAKAVVRDLIGAAEKCAGQWKQQLLGKREKPDEVLVPVLFGKGDWSSDISDAVSKLNGVITANNQTIANFEVEREQAKQKLRRHHLWQGKSEYDEARQKMQLSKAAHDLVYASLRDIRKEIDDLRSKLRTHGPAADQLNKLLHSYLGHKQISVKSVEDGYQICRDGKASLKPLSEGEKTALAFCYFLTALNSEGRKIKDLVVILDDPISSLDARAMTHVVSTIGQNFANPTQFFILTHNIDFMREIKKWLEKGGRKKIADFFFIETGVQNDVRSSKIIKLPKLIREYESEYHYLYSLVKSLAEDPNGFERFAYLMPNAIRKVLDIFLAFKIPGNSGLEPKVDKIIKDNVQLDAARVKAMERLAQLESHSESIGDVVTFSAYTLEQVNDAAVCLREVIGAVDPDHKSAMDGLC